MTDPTANPPQNFPQSEFLSYIVYGVTAFICDFGVLIIGTEVLGFHYLVSNIDGYASGMMVSYFINVNWVFRNRRFEADRRREFAYFTLIIFAGLTLSEAIIYVATEFIEVHYTISKAVSIFLFSCSTSS